MTPPPGVSLPPLLLAGVSSQRATAGVSASHADVFFLVAAAAAGATAAIDGVAVVSPPPPPPTVWSHRADLLRGAASFDSPLLGALICSVPSLAFSAILRRTYGDHRY